MYPRSQKLRSKRSPLTKQPSADAQLEEVNSEENNNNNASIDNNNKPQSKDEDSAPPHHAPRIMKGRRDREEGKERAKRSQSAHSLGQRNPLPSEDGINARYLELKQNAIIYTCIYIYTIIYTCSSVYVK